MIQEINLKELSQNESAKVEWKKNGDDVNIAKNIVKTICAFANDIANMGGGYIICGASEEKDIAGFQKIVYTGLSANKLKEIENKVINFCNNYVSPSIAPIINEMENPDNPETRILIFTVYATKQAHSYRDGEKTAYYVRIGKHTKEAGNGIFRQLMEMKGQIQPFDKRSNNKTDENDIDTLLLRDYLIETELFKKEKPVESYLSDSEKIAEFVPTLCERQELNNSLCLRNFALLMFGRKKSISLFFPDIYTNISIYNGIDRSEPDGERYTFNGSIIEQSKKILGLLETLTCLKFDKDSDKPNKEKYPLRAIQEAVINAIVHRDYELHEPIRITVFADRMEIRSPGSLHWGVNKNEFKKGKASPIWRNQSFAYLFNKLKLTQSEGQGISTIIRSMKAEGCPAPFFKIENTSITCILYANTERKNKKLNWKTYDDVVKNIFEILGKNSNYRIIGNKKEIKGKTGIKYKIDLLTSHTNENQDYLTYIECKFWNKKIEKKIVLQVNEIVDDCSFNKGIIVSNLGFTQEAVAYAKKYNIGLIILREISEKDWEGRIKTFVIKTNNYTPRITKFENIPIEVYKDISGMINTENYLYLFEDGTIKSMKYYIDNFISKLNNENNLEEITEEIKFNSPVLLQDITSNIISKISGIRISGKIDITTTENTIDYKDNVWLFMKVIFEDKTYFISENGEINDVS